MSKKTQGIFIEIDSLPYVEASLRMFRHTVERANKKKSHVVDKEGMPIISDKYILEKIDNVLKKISLLWVKLEKIKDELNKA